MSYTKKPGNIEKKNIKYKNIITNIKSKYGKTKLHKEDYFNYIKKFLYHIESVIGKNININDSNVYLFYDVYIINHDHNGYNIVKPLVIL